MAILANFSHSYGSHHNISYIFWVWLAYLTSLVPLFLKDIFASSVYFQVNLSFLIKYVYYACCYFYAWLLFSFITKSCPTLCDPMDCSLPVSYFHGISQARILEWVAISFSRDIRYWAACSKYSWNEWKSWTIQYNMNNSTKYSMLKCDNIRIVRAIKRDFNTWQIYAIERKVKKKNKSGDWSQKTMKGKK